MDRYILVFNQTYYYESGNGKNDSWAAFSLSVWVMARTLEEAISNSKHALAQSGVDNEKFTLVSVEKKA